MSDPNTAFTSLLLKNARNEAKEMGVPVPRLSTWNTTMGSNKYYEVYGGTEMIWSGTAYNAAEAKSNAIGSLIERMMGTRV